MGVYLRASRRRDGDARAEIHFLDIQAFEPREFIEAGEHVTALGWERSRGLDTGHPFESEWAHVFTVVNGRITRWRGFFNTAARYGMRLQFLILDS